MNQWLMGEYIEFVADRLISMLGYPKIYQTDNPVSERLIPKTAVLISCDIVRVHGINLLGREG